MKSVCLAAVAFVLVALTNAQAQDTRTGTTTTTTRVLAPAPPPALPPAPPAMIIPGGGNILNTPLSFRMTKIVANVTTHDGSPSDEVYVVATAVFLNWERLWESKVFTGATHVYEGMNDGDVRAINVPVWGDTPVKSPKDVIIMLDMMEHDNGATFLVGPMVYAAVSKAVKNFNPGFSLQQMIYDASDAMMTKVGDMWRNGGDDKIGDRYLKDVLVLRAEDLDAARAGSVVKIPVVFTDVNGFGTRGKYTVTFELSR